jgi:lysophospholipase L1-like esterase
MGRAAVVVVAMMVIGTAARAAPALPADLQEVSRILFMGDSLTDGSSYPDYVVNTLNTLFPSAGFEVHNGAVAGDTAAMVRKRFDADVRGRQPDLMVLCIGTNDCNGRRPVADYEADVAYIVSETLKLGAKVMIVLPSPFGKANAAKEEPFQAYLAVLRRLAATHNLTIADAHAEFVKGEAAGREMLGFDGIHHGKDGFAGMARAIVDALGFADIPLVTTVTPWPGLLTQWETSAPVPLDREYAPAEATGWRPYDAAALAAQQPWWNAPFPQRGAWMPFLDRDAKQVAYGRTFYDAPAAGKVELQVGGSPAPQIVWLNGTEVWRSPRPHGYHPNADRLVVEVKEGRNEIIVVSNFMIFVGIRELTQ